MCDEKSPGLDQRRYRHSLPTLGKITAQQSTKDQVPSKGRHQSKVKLQAILVLQ